MKTYLLALTGILFGGAVAFWIFALLFNAPLTHVFPAALFPLFFAATISFALAWVQPTRWKLLAACVALPTLLVATMLLVMLWAEGRSDLSWALVAGVVLCVCAVSSWLAHARKAAQDKRQSS